MSNENIFYSADYSNAQHTGLFDRIINIKFTRKKGDTITLHSDYEPVWTGGRLHFITCQPKPEIHVTYTHYQGVMINVDIYITNFNIQESSAPKTKDAQVQLGAALLVKSLRQGTKTNQPNDALFVEGNPIVRAEIEMGYRGNFFNWSRYDQKAFSDEQAYTAFQNLEQLDKQSDKIFDSQRMFKKHRRCNVEIEWAVNTSNPPDRVTQFHGYVGSLDSGFQPFGQLVLDNADEDLMAGMISKANLFEGLNDRYDEIDTVRFFQGADSERSLSPLSFFVDGEALTFRNFFNKGKAFTALEAICFNFITRRFIKSSITVIRNELLEQAALETILNTDFGTTVNNARDTFVNKITQSIYAKEYPFNTDSFVFDLETMQLKLTDKVSKNFKKYLETAINILLCEQFVGARYTVKDLPGYRILYTAIRNTIKKALSEGKPLSWWEALDYVDASNYRSQKVLPKPAKEFKDTLESLRDYTAQLQQGSIISDCFIKRIIFNDWILPVENLQASVLIKNITNEELLANGKGIPCFAGFLEVRDAYMFGVPVLCTEEASQKVANILKGRADISMQFTAHLQEQLSLICKDFGLLSYKFNNGSFLLYTEEEDPRDINSEAFVTAQFKAPLVLPAIYDLTISPVRKMRLPFIGFLDPMTVLEWNSSTTIGTMVSYYFQPEKGRNFFLIISSKVDFSTTGDTNLMELQLVDTAEVIDKTVVPVAATKQEIKEAQSIYYTSVVIEVDSSMNTWRKIFASDMTNIPRHIMELWAIDVEDRDEAHKIKKLAFFEAMSAWNPTLFGLSTELSTGWATDDGSDRTDKTADWLYGDDRPDEKIHFPEIDYCFTLPELPLNLRRIYLKFPILPKLADYSNPALQLKEIDKDYVLFYTQGTWLMQPKALVTKKYSIEGI